jgi:signal transduction histidine kinase
MHANAAVQHVHQAAVCGVDCPPNTVSADAGLGQQIADFFSGLFNTANWPARWHCGSWSDFHGWLYIFSDLLIWASYFAIPVLLIRLLRKRRDIPFPKLFGLFVAFILLCGTTHLLDAIIFWWPAYRLSALIRFFTGLISAITVYALYRVLPSMLSLKSVSELEVEITERKNTQQKLTASEFLLKEASRIGRMGAWEYDLATHTGTWGTMVYDIFELPYDFEIRSEEVFKRFAEPSRQQLRDAISQTHQNGVPWDLDLQIVISGGTHLWVRSCGEVVYDEAGKMSKFRGVFFDIDKQKTSEIELSRSHDMLFRSHQQLKTFTHILSHNIRNHASNISLLTDLVETETLNENNAELFDKISRVSHGLNETLNDLSEAIKIRESQVAPEVLSFRDLANHVATVLESEMLASDGRISFDIGVETIIYPKLYLESILMNLVSNAIKYRKPDVGPSIVIATYRDEDGRIILECKDNGLGIDLHLHGSRIFGLYKTFHNHKQAHGVGLFLVKTQVESQGGMISIESKPGEGATFRIVF